MKWNGWSKKCGCSAACLWLRRRKERVERLSTGLEAFYCTQLLPNEVHRSADVICDVFFGAALCTRCARCGVSWHPFSYPHTCIMYWSDSFPQKRVSATLADQVSSGQYSALLDHPYKMLWLCIFVCASLTYMVKMRPCTHHCKQVLKGAEVRGAWGRRNFERRESLFHSRFVE